MTFCLFFYTSSDTGCYAYTGKFPELKANRNMRVSRQGRSFAGVCPQLRHAFFHPLHVSLRRASCIRLLPQKSLSQLRHNFGGVFSPAFLSPSQNMHTTDNFYCRQNPFCVSSFYGEIGRAHV